MPKREQCNGKGSQFFVAAVASYMGIDSSDQELCPHDGGKSILFGKCGYHLTGAGGVLVDKNHHATVKPLRTESLSEPRIQRPHR